MGFSWSPNGSFVPANIDWDFTKRQPDVIVINLGTNDDSYTKSEKDRQEEYAAEYVNFLKPFARKTPTPRYSAPSA